MPEFRQIIQDIKKRKFAPIYLLMGEEPYYIDRIADILENTVVTEDDREFDQSTLYGADTNAAMVMEAAGQFPMMSDYRLVILKEAQAMVRAKTEMDKMKPYIGNPNPRTVLCIAFKGDKLNATSEIIKIAKKNPDIVVFDSPKIKENKLGEIIKDYCFANKIRIDEKAVQLLVANVGSSLTTLFSNIEKLQVALTGEEKKITADLVSDQIGISKEFNNFELISALSRRDYYQALNILKHFEENPKANPTIVTVSTIFAQFQKLLIAAFNTDKSDHGLMEALQLKNPYALRDIRTGLQNYNASQLVKAIRAIREFDTRSKGISSFQKEFPLMQELLLTLLTL